MQAQRHSPLVASSCFVRTQQRLYAIFSLQRTATEMQRLLVAGNRKEALACAKQGQLWGPALVLARQLGDKVRIFTTTVFDRFFHLGLSSNQAWLPYRWFHDGLPPVSCTAILSSSFFSSFKCTREHPLFLGIGQRSWLSRLVEDHLCWALLQNGD